MGGERVVAKGPSEGFADEAIHCSNHIRVETFGNGFQAILGLSCDVLCQVEHGLQFADRSVQGRLGDGPLPSETVELVA
jgi:hypothetical protein